LLYFLCLAVIVSWAIIVGVLIPLNFLAVELNNDQNYQVIDSDGNALAIRQSVGVASTFECSHDYLAQLQYLFITDLHKEQVLSVQVVPRTTQTPNQSPFTEVAMVTTATGTYTIPCTTTTKKRNGFGFDLNNAAVKWITSPHCGNHIVDSDEECDGSPFCDDNCLCTWDHTPFHGGCVSLCGNKIIDATEHCDSEYGCEDDCLCGFGFDPIVIATNNGTLPNSTSTGTGTGTTYGGCKPLNPCVFNNPCGLFQTCTWNGVTANGGTTCTCSPGFEQVRTNRGFPYCVDIDECSFTPIPCSPKSCINLQGDFFCH